MAGGRVRSALRPHRQSRALSPRRHSRFCRQQGTHVDVGAGSNAALTERPPLAGAAFRFSSLAKARRKQVQQINSESVYPGQLRHSNACQNCGKLAAAKHTGRKPRYCSDRCRDAHRRHRNFEVCGTTRYPCQAKPRNAENSRDTSGTSQADFGGRGSVDKRLWWHIVTIEVINGHHWSPSVSSDGVASEVTMLRPRALRGVP